jgi:predicted nucleotidyltransferase
MARAADQIRTAVKEFVAALGQAAHVQRVLLYGSYASRQAREESDIDIAVLSEDFARMSELEVIQTLAHRRIHCDSLLMPVGYTPAQFADPDNAFAREIAQTGKVVYQAPERALEGQ